MCDKAVPEDEGYLPEDVSDSPDSNWRLKWPPPACFRDCLQCGKSNTNPFFQYCYKCFKVSNWKYLTKKIKAYH